MKSLLFPALLISAAALAAVGTAAAQGRGTAALPAPPPRVINPSISLSAPASSPLQQQMQDDYAAQLRGTQHDLLQQDPSGLTRRELGISRALNGFTPR